MAIMFESAGRLLSRLPWCLPALLLAVAAPVARADCAHAPGPASALLGDSHGMADFRRVRFVESDDAKPKKEHPPLARTRSRPAEQPWTPCIHCRKSSDRTPTPRVNLLERGDLLALPTFNGLAPTSGDAVVSHPSAYHYLRVTDITPPPRSR